MKILELRWLLWEKEVYNYFTWDICLTHEIQHALLEGLKIIFFQAARKKTRWKLHIQSYLLSPRKPGTIEAACEAYAWRERDRVTESRRSVEKEPETIRCWWLRRRARRLDQDWPVPKSYHRDGDLRQQGVVALLHKLLLPEQVTREWVEPLLAGLRWKDDRTLLSLSRRRETKASSRVWPLRTRQAPLLGGSTGSWQRTSYFGESRVGSEGLFGLAFSHPSSKRIWSQLSQRIVCHTHTHREREREKGANLECSICFLLLVFFFLPWNRYAFNIIFNILNKSTLNIFPKPWLLSTIQLGK